MEVMSPPSSAHELDTTAVNNTAAKLREVFTFSRAQSAPLLETWKNSMSTVSLLTRSNSSVSSIVSSESDDTYSIMSPVPPAISGSPGDPEDLTPVDPMPITLIDCSMDDTSFGGKMWAKSAWVGDYSVVSGTGKAGAYVTWLCVVETLEGKTLKFRKRYSEFVQLQRQLRDEFVLLRAAIPALPPKSLISKFRPSFLEERRRGLEYFLACIILNPVFSGSDIVRQFISGTSNLTDPAI
ncbi:Phox homologous domain-containing protein [Dipodascopsis uninucleata]